MIEFKNNEEVIHVSGKGKILIYNQKNYCEKINIGNEIKYKNEIYIVICIENTIKLLDPPIKSDIVGILIKQKQPS